jgi:hypothetical protein
MLAPAENSATSTPSKLLAVSSSMATSLPLNGSVLPAERADASSFRPPTGKFRLSRQLMSSTPTAPVAPTMATTGALELIWRGEVV